VPGGAIASCHSERSYNQVSLLDRPLICTCYRKTDRLTLFFFPSTRFDASILKRRNEKKKKKKEQSMRGGGKLSTKASAYSLIADEEEEEDDPLIDNERAIE
jgi:hypothetical protein